MKSIAHIKPPYYLPLSETFVYDQLVGLKEFKHSVLTETTANLDKLPFSPLHAWTEESWLNPFLYRFRWRFEKRFDRVFQKYFLKAVEKEKPDLLHAHFGHIAFQHLYLKERTGLPFAFHFYGMDASELLHDPVWVDNYHQLINKADLIFVVSKDMMNDLKKAGLASKKMEVIPIGIDVNQFSFKAREPLKGGEKVKFLFVGRFVEKKGTLELIEAFAKAKQELGGMELHFVGSGPLEQAIQKKAIDLNLGESVKIAGRLDKRGVAEKMRECQALVLPSFTPANGNKEATPSVLKEAMASGLPVIATRHAGIPELVEDQKNGFLVEEHDLTALSDCLLKLADKQSLWAKLGSNGRKKVEEDYNLERQLKKQATAYEKII